MEREPTPMERERTPRERERTPREREPDPMEIALLGRYVKGRLSIDPDFATTAFVQLYVTLGAQRATKILGIFARLDRRDGKPQYLRHMPRIWRYLRRALIHPAMNDLKAWYDAHVSPPQ